MRFSNSFIPTTKETPNDATLPSHQYLLRAGFISTSGSGLYDYLPLGKIVLDKIRKIVKEELDKVGCQEVQLGFITPYEYWQESGRANKMGLELLRIKDRKKNDFVLSPTNEEAIVYLIKNRVTSYKDLPLNLYQINTKFRDEARPRFGLMRGREFLMKDGYSFHASREDMQREFTLMEQTYRKIFDRLNLDYRIVNADSGAIGGSGSKEFHVLANSGEDTIVICDNCQYSANVEAALRAKKEYPLKKDLNNTKIKTPNCKTIDEVATFLEIHKYQTIKAVVKKAIFEENSQTVIFFIRGTDTLETTKARNSINAIDIVDISEQELQKIGLCPGYIGIDNLPTNLLFKIDNELQNETYMVCGANEYEYHTTNIHLNNTNKESFADLIEVQEGDKCNNCNGNLSYKKGIEVGHIFQLGTKYAEALNAEFLDETGKTKAFQMGTYGIGVSRLMAAIIEQNHDEKGCKWTKESTPFLVDIIVSNGKNENEQIIADQIYKELKFNNIETIIDDRKKERFGFKIKDFELIGFPYAIIVGQKIEQNIVELVIRKSNEKIEIKIDEVIEKLSQL